MVDWTEGWPGLLLLLLLLVVVVVDACNEGFVVMRYASPVIAGDASVPSRGG